MARHLECLFQTLLPALVCIPDLPDDEGISAHTREGASLETRSVVRGWLFRPSTSFNLASGEGGLQFMVL